jgi:multisubunit Na+/H+ antiporter MnhB subunit
MKKQLCFLLRRENMQYYFVSFVSIIVLAIMLVGVKEFISYYGILSNKEIFKLLLKKIGLMVFVNALLILITVLFLNKQIDMFFNWFFNKNSEKYNGYYFICGLEYLFFYSVIDKVFIKAITSFYAFIKEKLKVKFINRNKGG